jgi:two-component system phosphate regulon response regulator PhoB
LQADEALQLLRNSKPDLVILDWMMPGKSGVQFARELRSSPATQAIPILMLTAKGEEADKVLGLDAGADDYVTKPFSPKELVARVKALLRRHVFEVVEEKALVLGPMQLDPVAHRLTIRVSDNTSKALALGPTEFRLMQFLMANPERVHSRTHLLDNVWGNEVYIEERTVDVHIKRLRAALAPFACDHFVETVRGSGYRITKNPVNT